MRAIQMVDLSGPESALRLVDVPQPQASDRPPESGWMPADEGVLIEVHAAGVSFPEVLQSRGLYQIQPPLPFIPGSEVAGIVRAAPAGARVKVGDRVAACCGLGAFAEFVVAPVEFTFPLADSLDFRQGAGLVLNYHTAYFSLVLRGRLAAGETVLVHGAAGGVGTATLQVAKGLGARTIAVVSTDEKERIAREAGADDVLRSDGPWKDECKALGGADIVIDPVGGSRFTDSIRCLREFGRVVVVGFTDGSIPEVKVNRLLLSNTEVVGAGWGVGAANPETERRIADGVATLVAGGQIAPIIGASFPLERAADALVLIDSRGALGKVVLDVG